MINIDDFSRVSAQYEACWKLQNHDAPLVTVSAKRDGARYKERPPMGLTERWTDVDYIIESGREHMQNTYYGGASYPILWPNLGPDIFGATLGCDIEFGESTSWAHPVLGALENCPVTRNTENTWYKKIVAMTRAIAEDSRGDYIAGITDLHGGMDGMVSLRGPEQLCVDMLDEPETVQEKCMKSFEAYRSIYTELNGIIGQKQKGSTNWMGVYHPEGWYVSSCDLICMISDQMLRDFVFPELKLELELYGHSIFHLDGPGALRHLDALLELDGIHGIQWVYGDGQPTAAHWIEVLQKIQKAGRMVHIAATHSDLPELKKYLQPEGLILSTWAENETQAKEIEAFVANWRKG